jgi:UPF0176 protein
MILNLAAYRFVSIADPTVLATALRERLSADPLRGTVLIAPEGINLFLAGPADALRAALAWLQADPRFAGLHCKWSESETIPFRRLLVKCKAEIISFRRSGVDPVGDPAPSISPEALRRWIERGCDDDGRELALLDTRNQQETEFGSFDNALCLPITRFTEFPAAIEAHRSALAGKRIVSFCTGGIRCEKAAPWLRSAGFGDVVQLDGGILNYFEKVGAFGYRGQCFVFDERVALDAALRPSGCAPSAQA